MAAVQEMAAGQKLHLGAVVVVGRVHRADDGDVVDTPAQVRPPVADLDAALPARFETDLERVDLGLLLVDDVVRNLLAHVLDVGRVQDGLVRRLGDRLAGVLVQLGLGVEALEMTDPAAHHQPDHALGPRLSRCECRPARIGLDLKHGPQAQADEAHSHVGQKRPARDSRAARIM